MPNRGRVRNRNARGQRDLSVQRILVLAAAIIDMVLSCCIAIESNRSVQPVNIVKPKNFGETIMMIATEGYFIQLSCKFAWAAVVNIVLVAGDYDEWGPDVLMSAIVTDIILLVWFIFTLVATCLSMEGIDIDMLKTYLSFISMEFFFPTLMCMIPRIVDLFLA